VSTKKAATLTTFAVSPDGLSVQLNFKDIEGASASLEIATACLNNLMMALPKMLRLAFANQYRDPSLRLVHPLANYRVEQMGDSTMLILTLQTPDGFEVSFSISREEMGMLSEVAAEPPARLS
jgi:hypothetical protein